MSECGLVKSGLGGYKVLTVWYAVGSKMMALNGHGDRIGLLMQRLIVVEKCWLGSEFGHAFSSLRSPMKPVFW